MHTELNPQSKNIRSSKEGKEFFDSFFFDDLLQIGNRA